jgi:hypothetical protein
MNTTIANGLCLTMWIVSIHALLASGGFAEDQTPYDAMKAAVELLHVLLLFFLGHWFSFEPGNRLTPIEPERELNRTDWVVLGTQTVLTLTALGLSLFR